MRVAQRTHTARSTELEPDEFWGATALGPEFTRTFIRQMLPNIER